jgi:hypothetical protein
MREIGESSVAWRDLKYQEVFDQELRGLERRKAIDKMCTPEDLEGILATLYMTDGSDWLGRGDLQDIVLAATIAAYEHFIAEWKNSENPA